MPRDYAEVTTDFDDASEFDDLFDYAWDEFFDEVGDEDEDSYGEDGG